MIPEPVPHQNPATVLLVDDEPANLSVLSQLLEPHYRVLAANSGERALRLAAASLRPDLILLDIMMPGMDGYEVLRRLRDFEGTRAIPVIFVTALDATVDEALGFSLGAMDYITKPIRPAVLLARVRAQIALKRMRDELDDRALQLEGEVQKRTEALNLALAAAQTAMQARRELFSNMSRELRTPIDGILGTLEMVLDEEISDEVRELLTVAQGSSLALGTLLTEILDDASATGGHESIVRAPYDPAKVARDVCNCFAAAALAKGIGLECHLAAALPETLVGDPVKLRRTLTLLIDNALKFTERGGVMLEVAQGDGRLIYRVSDTGCGIAPEKLGAISAPFPQADGSTVRRDGGIGLGLTLATELVELLGGTLQVESTLGDGSMFSFWVPMQ